jgi:SWI/SNF-related matrix-associated actin-dependent regulator of chromatin subfamily A-like protein 1
MLTFETTPKRVTEATKLAIKHRLNLSGVDEFWATRPQLTSIPGFALVLRQYQAEGVAHLERWNGSVLIADEPGTGKTATVLAYAHKNGVWPMLVIMPKTLLFNWCREIVAALGASRTILMVGSVPSQSRQAKLRQRYPTLSWSASPQPGYDITLINYDVVSRKLAQLEAISYQLAVIDESQKIKNADAARSQAILQLVSGMTSGKTKQPPIRVHDGIPKVTFLSGTPILNRPLELWTTLRTIAGWVPEFSNFWSFAQKFCGATRNRWGWDFGGASNLDQLHDLLGRTIMLRRMKADVMKELPPKTFVNMPLEFDRREYDRVAGAFEGTVNWKEGMDALVRSGGRPAVSNEAIVAINKLREIAGLAKIPSVVEWASDFVEDGRKLVIFAHNTAVVDGIAAGLTKAGVTNRVIRGGVSLADRDQAVEDFQNDPMVRAIVLNIASAGFGLTLTAASACAFAQLPWTAAEVIQCADRVHRLGQTDNVTVYNLTAENSVEEEIGDLIMAKAAVANAVIDGGANVELAALDLNGN